MDGALGDQSLSLATQTLAEAKSASFLLGGRASVFGVNLPCDRVVLLFEGDRTSAETIVQCLGRCGRTGKYTRSEVLVGSVGLLRRIFQEPDLLGVKGLSALQD